MAPIRLTDAQRQQVMASGYHLPRALRRSYLERVAELLRGRDFGDGDVHRACVAAMRAVMQPAAAVSGL